jgi:hypothetical protein
LENYPTISFGNSLCRLSSLSIVAINPSLKGEANCSAIDLYPGADK